MFLKCVLLGHISMGKGAILKQKSELKEYHQVTYDNTIFKLTNYSQ
jgi:hypothetical protein